MAHVKKARQSKRETASSSTQITIANIEEAASKLTSPTSIAARKDAEKFLLDVRKTILPESCCIIIDSTSNEFIITEMTKTALLTIFKKWNTWGDQRFFDFFLEKATSKFRESTLIRSEMFHACAKLLMRWAYNGKASDIDKLHQKIDQMFNSEDPQIRIMTYEFILIICEEFQSSWRINNFGITFDFHITARRFFETEVLPHLFVRSITTFIKFVQDGQSPNVVSLYENFLRLAELVLSWKFATEKHPVQTIAQQEGLPASTFQPPESWKPLFQTENFLHFFFELQRVTRRNEKLCLSSLNCLIRLSSVTGPVILSDTFVSTGVASTADKYIPTFITNFLEVFGSPFEFEALAVCQMVYKLLTNHGILSMAESSKSFADLIFFVAKFADIFTPIAMRKAWEQEDRAYIEGLEYLYFSWWLIIEHCKILQQRMHYTINFKFATLAIVHRFMLTVISGPDVSPMKKGTPWGQSFCLNDNNSWEVYKELLGKIGWFSSYYCEGMLPHMYTILHDMVKEFLSFREKGATEKEMEIWRINMHWILLFCCHMLTNDERTGSYTLNVELPPYYTKREQEKTINSKICESYIKACIESPYALGDPLWIDSLIKMIGTLFAWCSIEDKLLVKSGVSSISLELLRTSLWCTKRLISAIGSYIMRAREDEALAIVMRSFSEAIVGCALKKSFNVLRYIPDEKQVGSDAVEVLEALASTMRKETVGNPSFISGLPMFKIEQIAAHRCLLKVLIKICNDGNDEREREAVKKFILAPLSRTFTAFCTYGRLDDTVYTRMLECFCGVADAIEKNTAHSSFEFLLPAMEYAVILFSNRDDSQIVFNAVFEFFNILTSRMSVYYDNDDDMLNLYSLLLELIKGYRKGRFKQLCILQEQAPPDIDKKAMELIPLYDILGNVLTPNERADVVESGMKIVTTSLKMLIPIMEGGFFNIPTLCQKFYFFLHHCMEAEPSCIVHLPSQLYTSVIECLRRGLQSRFGQQISIISAKTVQIFADYLVESSSRGEQLATTKILQITVCVEPAFTMCLKLGWQEDDERSAEEALHSLIRCSPQYFMMFAEELMDREENRSNRATLQSAFRMLISEDPIPNFHRRLQQFLDQVQCLLVIE